MWHEGTIGIPTSDGGMKAAHYWVKSFDEPSRWGINNGRISKLMIKIDGKIVANYDRSWDIKPDEDDEQANIALCICLDQYN